MDPSKIISEHKEHTVVVTDPHLAASPHPSRGGGPLPENLPNVQPSGTAGAEDAAQRARGLPTLGRTNDAAPQKDATALPEPPLHAADGDGAAAPGMAGELLMRMDLLRSMNADLRQQLERYTGTQQPAAAPRQEEKRA